MSTEAAPTISEVNPREAWDILSKDAAAVLVDVRTRAEWGFVGGPDVSSLGQDVIQLEWKSWPGMAQNPDFVGALLDQLEATPSRLLFLCRSGVRSLHAAAAVADALAEQGQAVPCVNVAEGFEGDLDADDHRGGFNGWKARGLAWRQS
ncbi:rhodanese-like domain-containing protein [Jannaschia sp. M317]|uniref:rhodanese-like domain-containing protein n=1 Tax=Jannaschia sp. M317 TaxID=2867011 RepID=UPI0021A60611|nr:rhodanese-like domain-containing protein [Jannaschia sp. M317]UWQ17741.1 rhodanese-like domain-containing protein [Jannaschia sp. M317]